MRFVEERAAERLANLQSIRTRHHNLLVRDGIAAAVIDAAAASVTLTDQAFVLVRTSRAADITDDELADNSALADMFDIFGGIIRPDAAVLQIQCLQPVPDLEAFDADAGKVSLGVQTDRGRMPIDRVPPDHLKFIAGLLQEVHSAYIYGKVELEPDTLTYRPPTSYIRKGIPLV